MLKKLSLEDIKEHFNNCVEQGLVIGELEKILLNSLFIKIEKLKKENRQLKEYVEMASQAPIQY